MRRLSGVLLALVAGAALAAAPMALTPEQEARAQRVGSTLRCPVCSGLPITESTADIATQMQREVREQVAAGRSDREIQTYFTRRFGDTVLLDPPKEGANLLLWGLPAIALAGGAFGLARYLRGAARPPEEETPDPALLARVGEDVRRAAPGDRA